MGPLRTSCYGKRNDHALVVVTRVLEASRVLAMSKVPVAAVVSAPAGSKPDQLRVSAHCTAHRHSADVSSQTQHRCSFTQEAQQHHLRALTAFQDQHIHTRSGNHQQLRYVSES